MEIEGLTEFQMDLLEVAQQKLPKETPKIMRKVGSKARTQVAKRARRDVKKDSGKYHKKWKRGKVFKGRDDETVVRVFNSSPHAHLIEDGHRMVDHNGRYLGKFVKGKKVLDNGMKDFDSSGQMEKLVSEWLDKLLKDGKL